MIRTAFAVVVLACLYRALDATTLPAPSGKYPVGKTSLKSKAELVLLWYPAQRHGDPARYVSLELDAAIERAGYYEQSPETIRSWVEVKTHASENVPARSGRWPLLVFLPGQGIYAFHYSALAAELASRGYVVAVVDYFSPDAPARSFGEEDADSLNDDMARAGAAVLKTLAEDPIWKRHLRVDKAGVGGHSIGGAAALAVPRLDRRFRVSVDMDGAPFGLSSKGAIAPALVLRSKPVYSDADLAKRGRSREDWKKLGEEAAKIWGNFLSKSGDTPVTVLSLKGTGHLSFSDAPWVMPSTITRFGGEQIAPERSHKIIAACMADFLDVYIGSNHSSEPTKECRALPEILPQAK